MHSPLRFTSFSLWGLLTVALAMAILAANFAPRHYFELELDAATLKRIEHSSLPLNPTDPVDSEIVTEVTTKGWPAMVYLSHRSLFDSVGAIISGKPAVTHESYIDFLGVAINAFVGTVVVGVCYLVPSIISLMQRGRTITERASRSKC